MAKPVTVDVGVKVRGRWALWLSAWLLQFVRAEVTADGTELLGSQRFVITCYSEEDDESHLPERGQPEFRQ